MTSKKARQNLTEVNHIIKISERTQAMFQVILLSNKTSSSMVAKEIKHNFLKFICCLLSLFLTKLECFSALRSNNLLNFCQAMNNILNLKNEIKNKESVLFFRENSVLSNYGTIIYVFFRKLLFMFTFIKWIFFANT